MKEIKSRKNIRLKGYDYSLEGYYFITICTQNREYVLSNVEKNVGAGLVSAQVKLTYAGKIIERILLNLEKNYNVKIHDYVIMPNHIHFVIEMLERADTRPAPTIPQIICWFKSKSTLNISKMVVIGLINCFNKKFWQRNYFEHIIRNENEYLKIKEYIVNNPCNWQDDEYY